MKFAVLKEQRRYKRGRVIYFILSLENKDSSPIPSGPHYVLAVREVIKPDGTVLLGPSMNGVGEFGDITERSYTEVILRIDTKNQVFDQIGPYLVRIGQVKGSVCSEELITLRLVCRP